MNHLLIGTADKTSRLLDRAGDSFLLIDDGPVADAFATHFRKAKSFDVKRDSFNPLRGIDCKRARDFASAVYTASPEGKDTLTVRNGRRALVKLLLDSKRLDKLPRDNDPGTIEALATIDDLLLSPILTHVLCNPTNFSFKGAVIARLDRAQIGDFDAFILASLLIGQFEGTVIVPDFGFYGRDFYTSLIRQNRLIAGVNFLSELSPTLQNTVLLIEEKIGGHCTWEDAQTLARYAALTPDTTAHTDFVQRLVAS